MKDGRYRLVAQVRECMDGTKRLCAVIYPGSRSEQRLELEPSDWDKTLRSIGGTIGLVLEGRLKGKRLHLSTTPRTDREKANDLVSGREIVKRLGD